MQNELNAHAFLYPSLFASSWEISSCSKRYKPTCSLVPRPSCSVEGGSGDETSHTGYRRCIKDHPTPYHGNKPHVCVHSNVPIGAVLQPAYRDSTACLMTSEGHRRKTDPLCTPPSSPPLGRPAPDASAVARRM